MISAALLSKTPYKDNSMEKNKIIKKLIDLISRMNLPLSIVDDAAFKDYCAVLNSTIVLKNYSP